MKNNTPLHHTEVDEILHRMAKYYEAAALGRTPPNKTDFATAEKAILALFENYATEREQSYKKELLSKVDRFEVIDETGRSYVKGSIYGSPIKVEMDLQDDGRTLKVFVQEDVNQTTDSVDIGTRDVNGLREGEAKHV